MTSILIKNFKEVCIDNYKEIIELSKNSISIKTIDSRIIIAGDNMTINYISNTEIVIKGNISSVNKMCK